MSTPEEHSHLGPSGWDGFVRCPGKPNAEKGLPDTAGYEAAEGTIFHELAADCLEFGLEPEDFKKGRFLQDGFEIAYDDEMRRSARDGLDFIRSLEADPDVTMFVETRVDISPWTLPGQFGTADVILVNIKERWVIVFDWKYGKEPVYAALTYQPWGYALGGWQTLFGELFEWDATDIKVTIIIEQPRVPGAGGSFDTTMQRVLEFGQHVKRQAVLTTSPTAPRIPGEKQCRWCRARASCAELAEWHLENIGSEFDDLDGDPDEFELPKEITPERRSFLLKISPMISQWMEALHTSAYRDATLGNPTPGLKLVEGRAPARKIHPNHAHKYEQKLKRLIGDKAYHPPEILSPAQAEKTLGRKVYNEELDRFVDHGVKGTQLVPEEDGRPAYKAAIDEFDVL